MSTFLATLRPAAPSRSDSPVDVTLLLMLLLFSSNFDHRFGPFLTSGAMLFVAVHHRHAADPSQRVRAGMVRFSTAIFLLVGALTWYAYF